MAAAINVKILGDSRSLERAFTRANKSAGTFNKNMTSSSRQSGKTKSSFGGLAKGIAFLGGGYLGASGLISAVKASYGEMSESVKVAAQTSAALKSTGGVANVTAKHVNDLADTMLKKTGIDDEAIKTSENMLLTFTKIRNEVGKGNDIFDQATKAVADLATRMNGGATPSAEQLSKSSIQLGKALNDPVKGVGSLRRVGIQFTAAQVKTIKTLEATGHHLQAQKIILKELKTEFGGSAVAAGRTFPGQLNKLRETLRNLGATLLTDLIPVIQRVTGRLLRWLDNTKNIQAVQRTFREVVKTVTHVVTTAAAAFNRISHAVGGSKNAIKLLIGAFIAFKAVKMASSVAGVARNFGLLGRNAGTAGAKMGGARGGALALRGSLVGKIGVAGAVLAAGFALSKLIRKIPGWDKAMKGFGGTIEGVAESLGLVHNAGKQFEGKRILTGAQSRQIRRQAARLEAAGLSPRQAAAKISAARPNVALRDVQVLAGVFGNRPQPPVVVHTDVHLDKQKVGTAVTKHQQTRARRNPPQKRGPNAGR